MWVVLAGILLIQEFEISVQVNPSKQNTKFEDYPSEEVPDCKAYYEQFVVLLQSLPDQLQSLMKIAQQIADDTDDDHDILMINKIIKGIRNNNRIQDEPKKLEINDVLSLVFNQFYSSIICKKKGQENLMNSVLKAYNETILNANCGQTPKMNNKLLRFDLARGNKSSFIRQKHYQRSNKLVLNDVLEKIQRGIDNFKKETSSRDNASSIPIRYSTDDLAKDIENRKLFIASLNFLENVKEITNSKRTCIIESNELFLNVLEQIMYSYIAEFQCEIKEDRIVPQLIIANKSSIAPLKQLIAKQLPEHKLDGNSLREKLEIADDFQNISGKEFKQNLRSLYEILLDERIDVAERKRVYEILRESQYSPYLSVIPNDFHEKEAKRNAKHENIKKPKYNNRLMIKRFDQKDSWESVDTGNDTNYIDMTYMVSIPQIVLYGPKTLVTQRVTPEFYNEYMKLFLEKKDVNNKLIKAVQVLDGAFRVLYDTDVDPDPIKINHFQRSNEDNVLKDKFDDLYVDYDKY